ncbi:MAG: type II toxin-antitoxin system VapC family toxin [Gemmatimonadetes bacterium]|nr:type II toxin-antitoxin system VapC family toxin [Gemmatimonadota bacterium]
MIGLDTNVLVRYVVQDDPEQAHAATRLIEGGCTTEEPAYIGAVVLAELAWVLRGPYGYRRTQVAAVLRQVLRTVEFVVEEPTVAWAALAEFESSSADFADCWIGHSNRARGCECTYTFDLKASRGAHFELIDGGG